MNSVDADEAWSRPARLAIGEAVLDGNSPELARALAWAYGTRRRPRCLCRPEGVEMYVAYIGERYVVKRMPETGNDHAPSCPSFESPPGATGLDRLLGTAIVEDPVSGMTRLKLGFPMSVQTRGAGRSPVTPSGSADAPSGPRMSLRGLLHYLWDQADLTRWHPGFEGRRNWRTVRYHLHQTAEQMSTGGNPLLTRLYIPETFRSELRDQIVERRRGAWEMARCQPGVAQQLQILIAEVKELAPARHGHRVVLKHIPDVAFAIDSARFRVMERFLGTELALWSAADDTHLMVIATFGLNNAGVPRIEHLSLMPVTRDWLPIGTGTDLEHLERLVRERRAFRTVLRYDVGRTRGLASVLPTDRGSAALEACAA